MKFKVMGEGDYSLPEEITSGWSLPEAIENATKYLAEYGRLEILWDNRVVVTMEYHGND